MNRLRERSKREGRNRRRFALAAFLSLAATEPQCFALDRLDASVERMRADDVSVSLFSLQLENVATKWQTTIDASYADYALDFEPAPFDLLGEPANLSHSARTLGIAGQRLLSDSIDLNIAAAYRDGFPDFRSLWLDTYFDQHFSPLEGVPGHERYRDFQPSAASLSAGLTWEYVPANANASVTASRIQDNVSPGYEIDFDGIRRSDTVLATTSLSVVSENVLSPFLRSRVAITATDTTDRERRYSAEVALNASLSERVTLRARGGAATEEPQFDAEFLDLSLHVQATETVAVVVSGRRYDDTGEIENALLFTTAAPALRNDSLSLRIEYRTDAWSTQVSYLYSESNYAATNPNTDFFQNLYADRDWNTIRFSFSKPF